MNITCRRTFATRGSEAAHQRAHGVRAASHQRAHSVRAAFEANMYRKAFTCELHMMQRLLTRAPRLAVCTSEYHVLYGRVKPAIHDTSPGGMISSFLRD